MKKVQSELPSSIRALSILKIEGSDMLLDHPSVEGVSAHFEALKRRYNDAYFVARAQVRWGKIIKVCSLIFGGLVLLATVLLAVILAHQSDGLDSTTIIRVIAGCLFAVLVGVIGYITGISVCAVGQFMRATIDTAINTSTLLSADEKASVIDLY